MRALPAALTGASCTILAYGALQSEPSSRLTFPGLSNFRLVRVRGMRRVFAHPHLFLVREGVVDPARTLRLASLSAEPCAGASFVAAAFDVSLDDGQRASFVEREAEYTIATAVFEPLDGSQGPGEGVICVNPGSDAGMDPSVRAPPGMHTVWEWPEGSGLLPADVYLRHCVLAVRRAGAEAEASFLDGTLLADRATTLREYMSQHGEEVMACAPPAHLAERFGG